MKRAFLLLMLGACVPAANSPRSAPADPNPLESRLPAELARYVGCYRLTHGPWTRPGHHQPDRGLPEVLELTDQQFVSRYGPVPAAFRVRTAMPDGDWSRLEYWMGGPDGSISIHRTSYSGYTLAFAPGSDELVGSARIDLDIGPFHDEAPAALRRVPCPAA
jgi:hypothetical protein